MLDIQAKPIPVTHWLKGGESLTFLDISFDVAYVPGHSPGSLRFYAQELKSAFVGDLVFFNSIGRTDLPGGSFPQLEASVRDHIYTLPKETRLFA